MCVSGRYSASVVLHVRLALARDVPTPIPHTPAPLASVDPASPPFHTGYCNCHLRATLQVAYLTNHYLRLALLVTVQSTNNTEYLYTAVLTHNSTQYSTVDLDAGPSGYSVHVRYTVQGRTRIHRSQRITQSQYGSIHNLYNTTECREEAVRITV